MQKLKSNIDTNNGIIKYYIVNWGSLRSLNKHNKRNNYLPINFVTKSKFIKSINDSKINLIKLYSIRDKLIK